METQLADSLPEFNSEGLLPAGDYEMTFEQLRESHLVQDGDLSCEHWDVAWRLWLVGQFEVLVNQLWQVGIDDVFADGSFAENKAHPNAPLANLSPQDYIVRIGFCESHRWLFCLRKKFFGEWAAATGIKSIGSAEGLDVGPLVAQTVRWVPKETTPDVARLSG